MAQAKAQASPKRSRGSQKSQARSRGSTSKSKSGKSNSASRTRSKASGNGAARADSAKQTVDTAKQAVEHTAKDAGQAVGRAASKAKVPLMAGGAALAGAAGGLALGMHQGRRRGGIAAHRPHLKVNSHGLAKAAKEVGTFGAQMGRLASELQHTREAANGDSRHRSPLEVVLEGLTARRSRA